MFDFKKINNGIGWAMFALAFTVYTLTVEETASFWDCGEFIAVSYKLMVPHPPGAPFFLLIGRMFSLIPDLMGNKELIALFVNMISVISSAFSIMFLYWSIVLIGAKIFTNDVHRIEEIPNYQKIGLMISGIIGGLAYTFSDSFWFSAVEAEVYGMSSFFTAFVVWAMLKWEAIKDPQLENKWMILIAYTVGLSIGVHLLNLVTIPALAMIYFYKKHEFSWKGLALALFGGLVVVGIINTGVIPGLPTIAGKFEIIFVNQLGLPFGSGALVFALLFLGALIYGIIFSIQKQKVTLNTALLSFAFILIGYSSYSIILIRSNYDPPIDENDPENIMSFVSYLKREQYGDRPLLYGRTFMSERKGRAKQGEPIYAKGKEKYEIVDYRTEVDYDDKILLPRMYSTSGHHPRLYREWSGLREGEKPTLIDNLKYMFKYQIGHMYLRYFLWNFAGRESDDRDASWLSPFAPSSDLPEEVANNKARDNFYMLPLLLGFLGLLFQWQRDEKRFLFVFMLFILTGIAIVVYLNSPPVEPRERDYIYVGSFYAFAMWIGFGVLGIMDLLTKIIQNKNLQPIMAGALCFIVPLIMGVKGWDNHNRSNRFHSIDQAKNTLRSCAPNAVLFTGGDNDTFPLWYVQDVEGFRTDVRVVVLSYFSTDWYVKQMQRQVYESEPLPISFKYEQYQTGTNDFIPYLENERVKEGIDLKKYLDLVKKGSKSIEVPLQGGGKTSLLPSKLMILDVDSAEVIKKGIIPKGRKKDVLSQIIIRMEENSGALYKSDLMILDMLANFDWERPIYFNNTSANTSNLNVRPYLHLEGMAYRLLPMLAEDGGRLSSVNTEVMAQNLKKFEYRGFEDPNAYHDEEYKKFGANLRSAYLKLARDYYAKKEDKKAKAVLDTCLMQIPDKSIPYDYYIPQFVEMYHQLGDDKKAEELAEIVNKRAVENLEYIHENGLDNLSNSSLKERSLMTLQQLMIIYRRAEQQESRINELEQQLNLDSLNDSTKTSVRQKYFADKYKDYEAIFRQYYR